MLRELAEEMKYIAILCWLSTKSFMTYRMQALFWVVLEIMPAIMSFITISIIYHVSSGIAGWTYYQLLFLAASATLLGGIVELFVIPSNIVRRMLTGSIDVMLIRPHAKLTAVAAPTPAPIAFGAILSAFVLFALSMPYLQFTAGSLLLSVLVFAFGTLAVISFGLAITLASYHLLKGAKFASKLLDMSGNIGNYPISVFGEAGKFVFTFIVPFALAYYYPAEVLLGTADALGAAKLIGLSIGAILAFYAIFDRLMREYTSGGG